MAMAETVYGVEMRDDGEEPEGTLGMHAVAVVHQMRSDGSSGLALRFSPDLQPWEAMGMLRAAVLVAERSFEDSWRRLADDE